MFEGESESVNKRREEGERITANRAMAQSG